MHEVNESSEVTLTAISKMDIEALPPFVWSRTCEQMALPLTVVEKGRSPPFKKTKGEPSKDTGEIQFFPGAFSPGDGVLRKRRRSRRENSILTMLLIYKKNNIILHKNYIYLFIYFITYIYY